MALSNGSLILTQYTARVKDTGELIETTIEEEAKKSASHDPTRKYEPRLIAVGEGWVLRGVDEALLSADVGQKLTVEVTPEKGFGPREPNKVKMIPLRKFGEKADELRVGDEVEVDNRVGIVRFVGSGRAQVDFNHRFAGKTLVYEIDIVKNVETDQEKIMALIRRRLPIEQEKLNVTIENDSVKVELPSEYYLAEGLQIIKRAVANDIFKFVKSIQRAYFTEKYESAKPAEAAPPAAPPAAAAVTAQAVEQQATA